MMLYKMYCAGLDKDGEESVSLNNDHEVLMAVSVASQQGEIVKVCEW